MKYRIVKRGDKYYVEKKWFLIWDRSSYGYITLSDAEERVKYLQSQETFTIIKEY